MKPTSQAPPEKPGLSPIDAAIRSLRIRRGIWIVGLLSLGCASVFLANAILIQRNKASTAEAHGNLRSMSCSLAEFDVEYRRFPDAATVASIRERTESVTPMGTLTSNDFLKQGIVAEIQMSETNCYAAIPGARKPDNRMDGNHLLEKGECGYSYIRGQSSKDHPERPLVVTPLIPGTNRFDPKPFNGYAIVLRIGGCRNGDVRVLPINANGEVIDSSGKHILDPANPIWGGEKPVIAWPEL